MDFDLDLIVRGLKKKRRIFHSEADFQHALAWQIHAVNPSIKPRLEYFPGYLEPKIQGKRNKKIHVDIWLIGKQKSMAIEVKYYKNQSHIMKAERILFYPLIVPMI